MRLTDYDMQFFAQAAGKLGKEEFPDTADTFFQTDPVSEDPACMEYGFQTVRELTEMFDQFLQTENCSIQERELIIKACCAGTFKYLRKDRSGQEDKGRISEYIYEF